MERVRIEQLSGMQRNPVEGQKQGPDVLRNLFLERAGGYAPFAQRELTPAASFGADAVARAIGYDPLGVVALRDARSGGQSGYQLSAGAGASTSAEEYDSAVVDLAAIVARFGAYTDRASFFGRGLEDGSLNVEPLTVGVTIAQDTLDAGGVEAATTEGTALAFVDAIDGGYVYSCSAAGSLTRIPADEAGEAAAEVVADVSGTIGATVVDMAYGQGWLVILGSNGRVAWSNDDFATSSTATTTGDQRLSWDSRGNRFYAGGTGLFRSNVVGAATGPTAWGSNLEPLASVVTGAGVVNVDGQNVVAPHSTVANVVYSQDGGANWSWLRGYSRPPFLIAGASQENFGLAGVGRGIATDGTGTVLAVTSLGNVVRRKDALLAIGASVDPDDIIWTLVASAVDGASVALNAITWNEVRRTWLVVSENGGVFESSDGTSWVEAGRTANALSRIVVDGSGSWYATGPAQGLTVGTGAVGSVAGLYSLAAIATIPTPAGELVTNVATLQATLEEGQPASIRVGVPETIEDVAWLDALPDANRQALLDAVRVYVYVGFDAAGETERPELLLVKVMKLGDEDFLVRRRVVEALSRDALQAANVVVLRDSVTELHNERVWFTVPESYELPTAGGRPVYTPLPSASVTGFHLAGDTTQAEAVEAIYAGGTRVAFSDTPGAGIIGSVPVSMGDAATVDVEITAQSRATSGRLTLNGSYRSQTVTLAPGDSATVTLPPLDASSGLSNAAAVVQLNGAGTQLELVSVTAVTPMSIAPYGTLDWGYYFTAAASIPEDETSITVGGSVDLINTELQLTSEGGPFTVGWTEQGFMNLADPLNYVKVGATTSSRITDLASGPGQSLFVFCDNEAFAIYGDPGLDLGARIENFGVQRVSASVGHDVSTPVARLGSNLFCIHRGRVFAVTAEGIPDQPISAPVDLASDPFVQVIGDSGHNHVVARTEAGRILRFDIERGQWFEDPWSSELTSPLLLPLSPSMLPFASRILSGGGVYGSLEPDEDVPVRIDFDALDLGEKSTVKLWRRVRLHSSDDLEEAPVLTYRTRRLEGSCTGRMTEDGAWVFTLGRGVVGAKIDLSISIDSMPPTATIEPPIDIEFVPRYSER